MRDQPDAVLNPPASALTMGQVPAWAQPTGVVHSPAAVWGQPVGLAAMGAPASLAALQIPISPSSRGSTTAASRCVLAISLAAAEWRG